jgi:hypothetical protein
LVSIAGDPDCALVIHAVGHTVHPVRQLDAWPSEDRRTRMVAITSNLDPTVVKSLFAALTGASSRGKARTGLAIASVLATSLACATAIMLIAPTLANAHIEPPSKAVPALANPVRH